MTSSNWTRYSTRGFKIDQARIGYLYLTGLGGVTQDNHAAIGWIGLAAHKRTIPEIWNYWKKLKAQIPESLHSEAKDLISSYNANYGTKVNRVYCDRSIKSQVRGLVCWFDGRGRDEYNVLLASRKNRINI